MKISWGTGIALTIIVFMAAVISLVVYAHTLDVNLVSDNYYEQELKHQVLIDKKIRTQKLTEQLSTSLTGENIIVQFPRLFKSYEITGSIYLFRPSNRKEDLLVHLNLSSELQQIISTASLKQGLWRLKIDWTAGDSSYYNEKTIMIN